MSALGTLVAEPELAKLMNLLYGNALDDVAETNRQDLVTIFLTGIPGVTKQTNTVASEQLRLNIAIPPAGEVCGGDRLGDLDRHPPVGRPMR